MPNPRWSIVDETINKGKSPREIEEALEKAHYIAADFTGVAYHWPLYFQAPRYTASQVRFFYKSLCDTIGADGGGSVCIAGVTHQILAVLNFTFNYKARANYCSVYTVHDSINRGAELVLPCWPSRDCIRGLQLLHAPLLPKGQSKGIGSRRPALSVNPSLIHIPVCITGTPVEITLAKGI